MWSFFSRDPIKDFAYEIGEKVVTLEDKSLWSLHEGKKKTNGEPVSIFIFENKLGNESQMALVKAAFKRIKTLRHPNFLTYLDGLETEKSCYIATEPVIPLVNYLEKHLEREEEEVQRLTKSWGLHQIAKALSFLINDCSVAHNNICMASIFADKAGEWKLGGLEYSHPLSGPESAATVKGFPALDKYDPPEKNSKRPGTKWSADMWGFGCLVWESFNGSFIKSTSLKNPGQIPKSLVSSYCELVSANPKLRPNPASFIESCRSPGGFMDNKFVSTMLFIEEIQIQDSESKLSFFNGLAQSVDLFPTSFCKEKILPQLLHAFEFGCAGSAILAPLFKLGKLLSAEEYQKKMMPCIVKLFSSTDRATRVKLLQQIETFAEHLSPQAVNEKIFPSLISGFLDTNPVVREQTIKSMLHLSSKLNYKNLNEELLKHFARLQSKDDQGGIRTNTTICLGKIACFLHPQVRQKVLLSAYFRALKDPFPPARQAGVLAMAATHNFFTLQETAMKMLPALCQLTMDPEKSVRDQVFKTIKCFFSRLEKVSENPESLAEAEKDVHAAGMGMTDPSGWAGWAVSGMTSLTSKIYSGGKKPQPYRPEAPAAAPPKQDAPNEPAKPNEPALVESKASDVEEMSVTAVKEAKKKPIEDSNNGWGWGEMEDALSDTAPPAETNENEGNGWEDNEDDWGALEEMDETAAQSQREVEYTVTVDHTPASLYDWGQTKMSEDDFFSSLLSDSKNKTKPTKSSALSLQSEKSKPPSSDRSQTSKSLTVSSSTDQQNKTSDQWGDSDWNDFDDWTNDSWKDGKNDKLKMSKRSAR